MTKIVSYQNFEFYVMGMGFFEQFKRKTLGFRMMLTLIDDV